MNNLRKFDTYADYSAATLNYPAVSWIVGNNTVEFDAEKPTFKWKATYTGGSVTSADCDASSAITQGEIDTSNLVSVEIGDCVTTIGDNAFFDYGSLTSVTIPDSVTSIGYSAFYYCSSLTSVTIPNSVTSIRDSVFLGCNSLTSVTVLATTPPEMGDYVFNDTNDCPIYVPASSVDAYKEAEFWSNYASRIQAIPQ